MASSILSLSTPEPEDTESMTDSLAFMTPGSPFLVDEGETEIMSTLSGKTKNNDAHTNHQGHRQWVEINHEAKEHARKLNGGTLPDSHALYTSHFPNKGIWSTENLPEILFYLQLPQNSLKDVKVEEFTRDDGVKLRKFDILPDYVSVDVEGWLVHTWCCIDNRISHSDITNRMREDKNYFGHELKIPPSNTLSNRCSRGCRKILGSSMNLRGDSEIKPRVTIESVEQLCYENLWTNCVLSRSAQFPERLVRKKFVKKGEEANRQYMAVDVEVTADNLEETTFPLHHFCIEPFNPLLKTELEIALEPAMMTLWDLQKKADVHGLLHWKYLSQKCLPAAWFERTKHKAPVKDHFDDGCENCSWTPFYDLPAPKPARFDFSILRSRQGREGLLSDTRQAFREDDTKSTAHHFYQVSTKRRRESDTATITANDTTAKKQGCASHPMKRLKPALDVDAHLQPDEDVHLAEDEQHSQIYEDNNENDTDSNARTKTFDDDGESEPEVGAVLEEKINNQTKHAGADEEPYSAWVADDEVASDSSDESEAETVINASSGPSPIKSPIKSDEGKLQADSAFLSTTSSVAFNNDAVMLSIEQDENDPAGVDTSQAGSQFEPFLPYDCTGNGVYDQDPLMENVDWSMASASYTVPEDPFLWTAMTRSGDFTAHPFYVAHLGPSSFEPNHLDRNGFIQDNMARVQQHSMALHNVMQFGPMLAMPRSVSIDWGQVYRDANPGLAAASNCFTPSTTLNSFSSDNTISSGGVNTPPNHFKTASSGDLTLTDEVNRFWDLEVPLGDGSPLQNYSFKDGATVNMFPISPIKQPMGVQGRRVFTLHDDEEFDFGV